MKRLLSVLLTSLMLLTPLSGCQKEKPASGGQDGDVLSGVFRPEYVSVPEGSYCRAASYDEKIGTVRALVSRLVKRTVDGADVSYYEHAAIETGPDGIRSETLLSVPEDRRISSAVFVENVLWYVLDRDGSAELIRFDLTTGEADPGLELHGQFAYSSGMEFYVREIVSGADGNLYLYSHPEILVLSPEGKKICSVRTDAFRSMAADADGQVWVCGLMAQKVGMAPVQIAEGQLGEAIALPADTERIFFGSGHDLYIETDEGILALDRGEDGSFPEDGKLVMSYMNSNFDTSKEDVFAVLSSELVLAAEAWNTAGRIALYRFAGDVDLSSAATVRIALSASRSEADAVRIKIVEYNKTHDTRIVLDDYTPDADQWGDEFYEKERRLALELTTGTYNPDLVICMQDGPVYKIGAEQGFFRDLIPYAREEGLLSLDNLLGCVKRTFTDADGRLFALTTRFGVSAVLLSTPAILGEYAERDGGRTLEELLDFIDSLPEGTILCENLTRENAPRLLLGKESYAAFIDMENGSCSFDDEIFVRFLVYLKTLPTQAEYASRSPLGLAELDYADRFPYYRDGKIALKEAWLRDVFSFVEFEAVFGTKDWTPVGKPSADGYGIPISPYAVYAVTAKDEERAEAAWSVLGELMAPSEQDRLELGIPAFVSEVTARLEELTEMYFWLNNNNMSWGLKSGGHFENSGPGFETEFTEEDVTRALDLFENRFGVPYRAEASEDIVAIVDEEVSAYLGGVGTAQDCAKKIQSRASIWLAEHK